MMNANSFFPLHNFLLISRVGAHSLHEGWLRDAADRNFDVLISAYDDRAPGSVNEACMREYRPGPKIAGYAALFAEHRDLIRRYDYVALFDDDIAADAASISTAFAIAAEHNLKIAQPALHHASHYSYAATLRQAGSRLRFVNYVEMMCPIFRSDILERVEPLFSMGYESGIDLVWCNLVFESAFDFAIIDAATVHHTRPVGRLSGLNGFSAERGYVDDIRAVLARFGLPWLSCVPYAMITTLGQVVSSRLGLLWRAASLVAAIPRHPNIKQRARGVSVHLRHILRDKPRNIPVAWPKSG